MGKTRESGELLSNNLLSADHSSQTVNVGSAITFYGGTTGIISATRFKGNGDFVELDVDGHTELDNLNVSGVTTVASLTVNGNVSIAGTLTYEDVTNIDSIGLITARTGIKVLAGGADISGVVTATTFSGSGANLTNLPAPTPADTDVQVTYDVSSNGSSGYRFTGPGYSAADDNPDLYLVRGQRYRFINGTGSGHPFRIQSDTSGTAYTDGVSGSQSGTQDFNVQNDAPSRLYYQCTIHGGMIGNIYITGGADWRMSDVTTAQTPEIFTNLNVGIGTDNPLRQLEVFSTGHATAAIKGSDQSSLFFVDGDDSNIGQISYIHNEPGDSDYMYFRVNDAERLRITSGGRVNIGQASSVDHTLCVAGTDNTTSLTGGHNQGIQLQNKSTTDGTYSQIEWRTASGGRYARIAGIQDDANGNGGQLAFLTENTSGTTTERLRINSSGSVGIGITNPEDYNSEADDLVISSGGADTGITLVCGTGAGSHGSIFFADGIGSSGAKKKGQIRYEQNNEIMSFHTNEQQRLTIDLNGKVGIGTDNPNQPLHIHASGTSYIRLTDEASGTGASDGVVIGLDHPHTYVWNYEAGDFVVATSATEKLRINSSGQVSIGNNPTVASDTALHIELDGTREYLRLEGDGGGSNSYLEIEAPNNRRKAIIFKSGGTRRGVIGVGDSDEASATSLFLSASANVAGNDPHMVITSDGIVTIPGQPAFNAVGFSAHRYLNTWQGVALSSWNTVVQNGSHFNNTNGRFTAPVAGKYFFIFTTMFHNPDTADFAIYLNKNSGSNAIVLSNNHSGGGNSNGHQWNDATVQAVIELAANDYITAMASGSNSTTCYMYGASSSKYGSFCGFLIG